MEWLRLESFRLCQWRNVAFPHLETDPERLQRSAPFTLDLLNGRAFVSLVAFTLKDMRPRVGGCVFRKLFNPFGTHRFLNVRTYVKGEDSRGIYFLSAFLDARRLNLITGPLLYGLRFYTGRLVSNTPQARTESQVLFFERAVPCAMPDE